MGALKSDDSGALLEILETLMTNFNENSDKIIQEYTMMSETVNWQLWKEFRNPFRDSLRSFRNVIDSPVLTTISTTTPSLTYRKLNSWGTTKSYVSIEGDFILSVRSKPVSKATRHRRRRKTEVILEIRHRNANAQHVKPGYWKKYSLRRLYHEWRCWLA